MVWSPPASARSRVLIVVALLASGMLGLSRLNPRAVPIATSRPPAASPQTAAPPLVATSVAPAFSVARIDPTGQDFRDPFYAFMVQIAESDSLGSWTRDDLLAYAAAFGRPSKLPLDHVLLLERIAVEGDRSREHRGRRSWRIWRVTLAEKLEYPLPYRVLGCDLGSLNVSQDLVFSEWSFGACKVYAPENGEVTGVVVDSLTVFRLERGWIVMDVAGLADRLLGRKLDDCWTQGFAICRQAGRLYGLAVSCNRDLRPICGEIDFATNEIIPVGRPLARGVAVYVRPWLKPDDESELWAFRDESPQQDR